MAKFVIRKVAYFYNDEYDYAGGEGGIDSVFDDGAKAESIFRVKEITAFREDDLGKFEPLYPSCRGEAKQIQENLDAYFKRTFHIDLNIEVDGYKGIHRIHGGYKIPDEATDEQVWEIKEITGIRFYTLSKIELEDAFYIVSFKGELLTASDYTDTKAPYFFNTKEDALAQIYDPIYKVKGKLADLSDTPEIFIALVKDCKDVIYNAEKEELIFELNNKHGEENKKALAVLMLLKDCPVSFGRLSIEEAKKISHHIFEMM